MNALLTPRSVPPCPRSQVALEPAQVRAYARLAAAIVDVPDEIVLAILMSEATKFGKVDPVVSH